MNHWITLTTAHGPVRAWQALPDAPARAGLVVIQEIFGANAHIRHVAEQYAAEGYAVLAPSFFDPIEPGLELDYDAAGTARGRALVDALGVDRAVDIVDAAAHALAGHGKVGTVGYCWGGTIALLAAQRLGLPSASYYGARNVPFLDAPFKAPAIFHFGAQDPSIPAAAVAAHREKQPSMQVYVYPAGHAFNREVGAHYHAPSAALARERTLAFLSENLR
ncbi:dienelactone hydrolase family protein [Stenotrophomonas sp. Y6]|uniref:dienelactone hydrolase family protein n=1 Tax=Stenotrophomonas sp. Y6 TaxID=2920383 RepID=UPI001F0670D1|nr:dienelactone hydrolase family protein [Stenotrophomonas sp. Y6]MCH1907944.1 dienelactone hydrolase family protein [Stenotrophomonas sp. Y6]